ncbi:MAG: tRNA 2-thiouridine(34) synthase MnmA [Syntrophomonas sp.]
MALKIAVLMSGGVDSTVSALLLKEAGCQILGLTMIGWDEQAAGKAAAAARGLGIEHRVVDLRGVFQDKVVDYFCRTYERGETPNPCVECNRWVKFGALLDAARQMGCEKVATGHYARIEEKTGGRFLLKRGRDQSKDQSYFLYALSREQLAHIVFPLGDLSKNEVRALAVRHGLPVAEEKESQEICFVADDYRDFLKDRVWARPGEVVDRQGQVLGTHRGIPFYTIGQRKGLGIAGGRPLYVTSLQLSSNRVIMGDNHELFSTNLLAEDCNFIIVDSLKEPMPVQAKIRYRAALAEAVIAPQGNLVRVEFEEAQRAITPGQSVVFYNGDYVVGGGRILK